MRFYEAIHVSIAAVPRHVIVQSRTPTKASKQLMRCNPKPLDDTSGTSGLNEAANKAEAIAMANTRSKHSPLQTSTANCHRLQAE